jgi:hypothetical protein
MDDSHPNHGSNPQKPGHAGTALLISFVLMFVVLALLACWPLTKQFIPGLADQQTVQYLGPVENVSFVGGFSTRTQVQVGSGVILLRGAVEIERGALVERRIDPLEENLCLVGTNRCHEIVSR